MTPTPRTDTEDAAAQKVGQLLPRPDPSERTSELLEQRLAAQRDYVDGVVATLVQRLDGMDQATNLRLDVIDHLPDRIDEKVDKLAQVVEERFRSVAVQFAERDERAVRAAEAARAAVETLAGLSAEKFDSIATQFRLNQTALDAALQAQKESAAKEGDSFQAAVNKSELATEEKINKLAELLKATTDGLGDKNDDLKERVGRIEAIKVGVAETRGAVSSGANLAVGLAGVILTIIIVALAIYAATH